MHSSYKYYILLTQEKIFSFAHSTFLTINSLISSPPFIFSLFSHPHYHPLQPLLFPQISFSICISSIFFSLFLLPSVTPFFNKVFFFSPHRSINGSIIIFGIFIKLFVLDQFASKTIWPMWHFELFKMELKVIMVILNYEKYGLYIYIYVHYCSYI